MVKSVCLPEQKQDLSQGQDSSPDSDNKAVAWAILTEPLDFGCGQLSAWKGMGSGRLNCAQVTPGDINRSKSKERERLLVETAS